MTSVCSGGGPSQQKTGYNDNVSLSVDAISGLLGLFGFGEASAALSLLITAKNFYLPVFCAADPPSDPGVGPLDVAAALNYGDPQTNIPAIMKLSQWFQSQYWYQVCECSSGTQPTPPTASDPGPVGQNSGAPNGNNAPCFDNSFTASIASPGNSSTTLDATPSLLPTAGAAVVGTADIGAGSGLTVNYYPIESTITSFDYTVRSVAEDLGLSGTEFLACNFYTGNSSGAQATSQQLGSTNQSGDITGTIPHGNAFLWPSSATHYGISCWKPFSSSATGVTESLSMELVGKCSGPSLGQICCPPDPEITSKLDQIYSLLLTTYSTVPVRTPNYAAGTAHSGLSGNGTIGLDATTTAVLLVVDTLPAVYTVIDGTPLTYLDIGWVTPVTNQGPEAGIEVTRATQVIPLPAASISLDYTFPPGQSVTVTELQPG